MNEKILFNFCNPLKTIIYSRIKTLKKFAPINLTTAEKFFTDF